VTAVLALIQTEGKEVAVLAGAMDETLVPALAHQVILQLWALPLALVNALAPVHPFPHRLLVAG